MNTERTSLVQKLAIASACVCVCISCIYSAQASAKARPSPAGWFSHGSLYRNSTLDVRLGGRLHLDGVWSDSTRADDNFEREVRRARVILKARYRHDWRMGIEVDAMDVENPYIRTAWIGYYGFRHTRIRLGKQLPVFGLEESTSSDNLAFMERSLQHVFSPDNARGISVQYYADQPWTFALGYYNKESTRHSVDARFITARATYAHELKNQALLHFGVSSVYTYGPGGDLSIRYRPRPESHLVERGIFKSARMKDVDTTLLTDFEFAFVRGPVSLQSEVTRLRLVREKRNNSFEGWYVSGSWLLTGESHNYDARFGRYRSIRPQSRHGALELSARTSHLDLGDRHTTSSESNTTVGLNWYRHNHSKLSLNWVQARSRRSSRHSQHRQNRNWLQLRFQKRF